MAKLIAPPTVPMSREGRGCPRRPALEGYSALGGEGTARAVQPRERRPAALRKLLTRPVVAVPGGRAQIVNVLVGGRM
jgi:hypothetical protein